MGFWQGFRMGKQKGVGGVINAYETEREEAKAKKEKKKEIRPYEKVGQMREKRLSEKQKHEFAKEVKPKKLSGRRHKSFPVANKRMKEMNIEARRLSGRSQ